MRRLTSLCRPCPPPKAPSAKRTRPASARKLRRPPRRAARRLVLVGGGALGGLIVLAALIGLWASGWFGRQADAMVAAVERGTADLGLAVEEVLAEGRVRTPRAALLAALEVRRGQPILALDPRAAKARVEALPWVRRATVERRLPSLVYLRLEERRPMALWQLDGRIAVIDELGEVVPGARPEDFAELILVVGPDAPAHTAALLGLLEAAPDLRPLVVAAVRVGGRRWNLRMDGGIDVRLPETDAAAAWAQFARVERQHGVLRRDVDSIDLRLPDRLVVRTAPDAEEPAEATDGKST